jgi:hypothetical protein
MRHEAIFALYPNAISVVDGIGVFDKDENIIEVDEAKIEVKAAELQAIADAEYQAKQTAKQATEAKLAALGITPEDLKNLLGV